MRSKISREKLALLFVSFWLTIFALRTFLFLCEKDVFSFSGVNIRGYHIHHYVFGFLTILVLGVVFYLKNKKTSDLRVILLGISFGLVLDEASFWLFPRSSDYWGIANFIWASVFGFGLAFLFFSSKEEGFSKDSHRRAKLPKMLIKTANLSAKKFSYILLLILAAFIFSLFYIANPDISQAKIIRPIKGKIVMLKERIKEHRAERERNR